MKRKSKFVAAFEMLILVLVSGVIFSGIAVQSTCGPPPPCANCEPPPPPGGQDALTIRQPVDARDAVCLGDTKPVLLEGSPAGANVRLTLISGTGDARFSGPNGPTVADVSGLPNNQALIYGQAVSPVPNSIRLDARMTFGGAASQCATFSVIQLTSLQVTNATQQPGGCYLATTGSGNVIVSAVTQPSLQGINLVENVLEWSGGTAGGALQRTVSRATPGATTVTSGCGPAPQSVTIAVVETCGANANVQPSYFNAGPAALPSGRFGRTTIPNIASVAIDINAKACFDSTGNLWRIRVNSITYKYLQSVSAQGRTPVLSANDSAVTESTYCQILQDLTPQLDASGNMVAPYSTYVALNCVQAHENQHVQEWKTAFDEAWRLSTLGESVIEQLTAGFVCSSRDTSEDARNALQPQIFGKLTDTITEARDNWVGDDPPNGTSQAYSVENSCLATLRQSILDRAQNANWRRCP